MTSQKKIYTCKKASAAANKSVKMKKILLLIFLPIFSAFVHFIRLNSSWMFCRQCGSKANLLRCSKKKLKFPVQIHSQLEVYCRKFIELKNEWRRRNEIHKSVIWHKNKACKRWILIIITKTIINCVCMHHFPFFLIPYTLQNMNKLDNLMMLH